MKEHTIKIYGLGAIIQLKQKLNAPMHLPLLDYLVDGKICECYDCSNGDLVTERLLKFDTEEDKIQFIMKYL